jgi:large subunit ribosomal protein L1
MAEKKKETKEATASVEVIKPEQRQEGRAYGLLEGIKAAGQASKQRKFTQSWDLSINLKGVDLKKPENRFSSSIPLPHGKGRDAKVAVFADLLAKEAEEGADLVIRKNEIDGLAKDKKKLKKLMDEYDWFFSEASLLPGVVKSMGAVMGPRGKVPKPIPPNAKPKPMIIASKKMVRVALKDTPVIHVTIGNEKMPEEQVAANAEAVFNFVKEKIPKGVNSIKSVRIKLTMGPSVKVAMK